LYEIWVQDPKTWSRYFRSIGNNYLTLLSTCFRQFYKGELSLENVRDDLRQRLHAMDPPAFPFGCIGASVGRLASELLKTNGPVTSSQDICTNCDHEGPVRDHSYGYFLSPPESRNPSSTSKLIQTLGRKAPHSCPECMCDMTRDVSFNEPPKLLVIEYPESDMKTSHSIKVKSDTGPAYLYLRGIIYLGGYHFTSQVIAVDGTTWYHDGRTDYGICQPGGSLKCISNEGLRVCGRRKLVLAVYTQP
jgi:hypothetical protein